MKKEILISNEISLLMVTDWQRHWGTSGETYYTKKMIRNVREFFEENHTENNIFLFCEMLSHLEHLQYKLYKKRNGIVTEGSDFNNNFGKDDPFEFKIPDSLKFWKTRKLGIRTIFVRVFTDKDMKSVPKKSKLLEHDIEVSFGFSYDFSIWKNGMYCPSVSYETNPRRLYFKYKSSKPIRINFLKFFNEGIRLLDIPLNIETVFPSRFPDWELSEDGLGLWIVPGENANRFKTKLIRPLYKKDIMTIPEESAWWNIFKRFFRKVIAKIKKS